MRETLAALSDRFTGQGVGSALLRGASAFLGISVVGTGLAFLLHVLLARVLGPGSYGQYAYAINMMAILMLGGHLGYQHASIRFVSQYNSARDWERLRGFYRASTRSILLGSCVMSTLILLGTGIAQRLFEIDAERLNSLRMLALLVPVSSFAEVWSGRLRGLKAISQSQVPTAIIQPIVFALLVLGLVTGLGGQIGAPFILMIASVSWLVSFAVSAFLLRQRATPDQLLASPRYERGEWRRVANSFLLVSTAQIVRHRSIILILGFYQAAAEIGFYSSANRVASLAVFGLTAVAAWVAPLIAQYHAQGEQDRLQTIATIAARFTLPFSLAATLVIVVFGRQILGLFGPAFEEGYAPLVVIALGQLVNGVTGPVGYLLTMTGNQGLSAQIEAGTAVFAVVACLALVPSHGLMGAAYADAGANVLRNAALFVAVRKRLGIRSTVF